MSAEVWDQVYRRLTDLVAEHRTTLIFVNTRRMAERATRHLSEELLGEENVAAHHGSLAKEQRLDFPRSSSSTASLEPWSPPPRSSSALISATLTWSASSARPARSRAFCSVSVAPAMRLTAPQGAGFSRFLATSWLSAQLSSTASIAVSSTVSPSRS